MSRIPTFSGNNQNIVATDWLALIDRTVAMRDNDADKLDIFSNKLFVESPADVWYASIPSPINKHWKMVRELFVMKWVEGAQQDEIEGKLKLFLQELQCPHMGGPALDVFSVTPVPPSSPAPVPFNLRQLEQVVNLSDVAGIAAFCATAVGTKHGYIARIWELAFNAGKNSISSVPNPQADAGVQTMPLTDEDPAPIIKNPTCLRDFDWSQDAESLPIATAPPSQPRPLSHPVRVVNTQPRDLSVLRSPSSSPFSSLQHRSKRFNHYSHQPRRRHSHFNFNSSYSPHYNSFKRSQPHFHTKTYSHLNWESDPRLSDLSRSLKALGWIRAH